MTVKMKKKGYKINTIFFKNLPQTDILKNIYLPILPTHIEIDTFCNNHGDLHVMPVGKLSHFLIKIVTHFLINVSRSLQQNGCCIL